MAAVVWGAWMAVQISSRQGTPTDVAGGLTLVCVLLLAGVARQQSAAAAVSACTRGHAQQQRQCAAGLNFLHAAGGRRLVGVLLPGDAAIMALANGVLGWHRNSAFSGRDGAPLAMAEGGYSR
jgi:NADH pyrophosphatase NudC (nudix superfamily)